MLSDTVERLKGSDVSDDFLYFKEQTPIKNVRKSYKDNIIRQKGAATVLIFYQRTKRDV